MFSMKSTMVPHALRSLRSRIASQGSATFCYQQRLFSRSAIALAQSSALALPQTIKSIVNSGAIDSDVNISGWVRSVRIQKHIAFAEVSDGSTQKGIQIIIDHPQMATGMATGAAVEIKGTLKMSPGREQGKEILAKDISIVGSVDSESYPLQKKRHTLEFLREIGNLRARSQTIGTVMRLRDHAEMGLHKFFHKNEFIRVHTPTLTSNDCEGGGETFYVATNPTEHPAAAAVEAAPGSTQNGCADSNLSCADPAMAFFGKRTSLTVSGQLHLEAMVSAFKRVYNMNQAFRAEPSQTGRHLSEFWMVEAECAFIDKMDTILDIAEAMVRSTTQHILDNASADIGFFTKNNEALEHNIGVLVGQGSYPRITYTEAIGILQNAESKAKFQYKPQWGSGLQSEHERYLATEYFKSPVFVTDYPIEIKPFYMSVNPDGRTVACMDMLVPGPCELLGGSMREHDYKKLSDRLDQMGLAKESLQWYLDLRKYGSTPHGGFGMGFERYIQMLTGLDSLRDIIPFPRYIGRCQY